MIQNTLALLGGRFLGVLLSVGSSILLARFLGNEQLGQYGALYAYLTLFGWLCTFGLEPILAREAAQHRAQASSILLTGALVSAGFSLAAGIAALLLAPYFGYSDQLRLLLVLAAIDLLLLAPFRLPGIIFQVDLRQWYGVGIALVRQTLWFVALVLLAVGKAAFLWVIVGRLLCGIVEAAVTVVVSYRRGLLLPPWRFLPQQGRVFLKYGFPIAISTLATGVYHRIDQVMLHNLAGDQVLGSYVAAVNITELFSALPVALMATLFPVLSQVASQDDRFQHYLELSFRSLMAVVFGVCALIVPLAEPLVHLLYGVKFLSTGPLLAALIWSEVPVFFGVIIFNALIARNLQGYLPLSTGIGAGLNVALNFFLIPRWGALGAAWATNVSYSLAAIFLFLVFRRTRGLAWQGLRIAMPPCLLALFITAVLSFLSLPVFLKVLIAAAVYGLGAFLTQMVRWSEVERVWHLMGRSFTFVKSEAI